MPRSKKPAGPPRVLILCAVDFTVRQFLAPSALALQRRGLQVSVACTRGPHWAELKARGLDMVHLPIARSANVFMHAVSILRLAWLLRRRRIDVLHAHTPVAGLVGRVAAFLARTPFVFYTAHGFYFHEGTKPLARALHVELERIGALLHDALLCVSEEDVRTAEHLGIEKPSRIYHAPNGVDAGEFYPPLQAVRAAAVRNEFGIPQDAPLVTAMGRLVREKGFFEFLEAAKTIVARRPDVRFLIVGDRLPSDRDRIRAKLQAIANEPPLAGRVILAGFRPDVPALLAASTVFCLPSWREGLPVSIIEAMMMELPVVATRIRGCREEVVDGSTGFLVAPRRPAELAGAIVYLLDHPDVARKMGQAGRRRADAMYRRELALDREWRIYQQLLGSRLAP